MPDCATNLRANLCESVKHIALRADKYCEGRDLEPVHRSEIPDGQMRHSQADPSDAGTPVSIEAAFRRVRVLVGALVLVRLWSSGTPSHFAAVLLVVAFWSINFVAYVAERQDARTRVLLGVVQLLADTVFVLLVAWAQHPHTTVESADWAILVLPAIE